MEYAIEASGMSKTFGSNAAIQEIGFKVRRGEIFGLLGPSGSGKTTAIKILTGELSPSAGEVEVLGTSPSGLRSSGFKSRVGLLSDNSALYERLTVRDNLKLFCRLYDVPLTRIGEILETVNLQDAGPQIVSKLSKGMKQRVLLAKALIHKPELVFLDEPTSALDPQNAAHIHMGLQRLNEAGTTIFLTTHNMEEAALLCDRVAFLHLGRFRELDSPEALRHKYSTHAFHVETTEGERLVIDNEPASARQIGELVAAGRVKAMHTDHPTLGQIFLKITGKELEQ